MRTPSKVQSIRVLSVIPPMTQLNTPYPATACLTGFLRGQGVAATQEDLALALVLKLFSRDGLSRIQKQAQTITARKRSPSVRAFLAQCNQVLAAIEPTLLFYRGRTPHWPIGLPPGNFCPKAPALSRWRCMNRKRRGILWPGPLVRSVRRIARNMWLRCFLSDLADVIRDAVDPRFEFARYAESLAKVR